MSSKIYDLDVNPEWHRKISFAKSGVRIISCGLLIAGFIVSAGVGLLLAEVLGIVEELV